MTNATDLVPAGGVQIVGSTLLTPAIFASTETVDDILAQIRKEAERFMNTRDISTKQGREAISSFAHKIARSKTALDDLGKNVVSDWKAKANTVDAERRRIREDLDALKDDVRAPLTEWETRDKARCAEHEAKLLEIRGTCNFSMFEPSSDMVIARINELATLIGRNWEEFAERAARASAVAGDQLDRELVAARKREAERAERERLAREREEQERIDREGRIAEEARRAAEERERQAVEAARREVEEAEAKARREVIAREALEEARRLDAENAAAEAEHQRVFNHEGAIALIRAAETADPANTSAFLSERLEGLEVYVRNREWEEFTDAAVAAFESAKTSLEQKIATAKAREERDRADREARIAREAREAEQQRAYVAAEAERQEQERRENNKRIRNRVRKAIEERLSEIANANGLPFAPELVFAFAQSIIDGEVPHVTVTF